MIVYLQTGFGGGSADKHVTNVQECHNRTLRLCRNAHIKFLVIVESLAFFVFWPYLGTTKCVLDQIRNLGGPQKTQKKENIRG